MKWNEDAWDLKHSSTIWWASTKPAACVRPMSSIEPWDVQKAGCQELLRNIMEQMESHTRHRQMSFLSEMVTGRFLALWYLSGIQDSNLCGFLKLQTIKPARLEWYGLRVLIWEWLIKRFAHCKDLKGRSEKGVAASSDQKPEVCIVHVMISHQVCASTPGPLSTVFR